MLTIRWRFISFILSLFYQLGRSVTWINSFTAKSQQSQQLAKFPNFILWNVEEQIVPCESTSKEVSFEWLHISISSTDSKVRATLPDAILYSVLKGSTAYVCGVYLAITGLKIMFGQNGGLTGQKLHSLSCWPVTRYFEIPPLVAMRNDVRGTFHRGSPTEFFDPVILTQNCVQSRNPEGYFWHPAYRAYFQSWFWPRFCFKIPNPELQTREISDPENLLRTLSILMTLRYPDPGSFSDKLKICFIVITLFSRSLR